MIMMEKIDEIYEEMQKKPLSYILTKVQLIALEFKDYECYCMLNYWANPMKNKDANEIFYNNLEMTLLEEGLAKSRIRALNTKAIEEYIKLRRIREEEIFVTSIKEMEDLLVSIEEELDSKAPEGLAPIDAYVWNQKLEQGKAKILEQKIIINDQIALLRSFIKGKLITYQRKTELEASKEYDKKRVPNSKNVFVIHGHNEAKRRELENLLKDKFELNPIVLADQPNQGLTIIEKFEKYAANCSYAIALFTPDDIVTNGKKQYFQARPNVIFELGWFYAKLGRKRVCILNQKGENNEIFSDLQGVLRMQFDNDIGEKYLEIERELKSLKII